MQRSSERILSTHVGSVARPHDLLETMREKEHDRPYDPARFAPMRVMVCTGPVAYSGQQALATDIANLRAALADRDVAGAVTEAFLPSTSPSGLGRNDYYATEQDYLTAVAEAMREEYLGIVEAGSLLQIDQHEGRIWADQKLPDGKILLPGLLGPATNYVEHPELIADTICAYAGLVGRENVIASADCGFSSRASFAPEVHPTVVWAKFAALAEGAAIATKRLWGGS